MFPLLFIFIFLFIGWFILQALYKLIFPHHSPSVQMIFYLPPLLGIILLLVLLAYNLFLYDTAGPNVAALGIAGANILIVAALILNLEPRKRTPLVWIVSTISIMAGIGMSARANGFVQSINGFVIIASAFFLWFRSLYDQITWHSIWLIKYSLIAILHIFKHVLTIKNDLTEHVGKSQTNILKWIKTIIITIFVIAVFTALLSAADPVFDQLVAEFRNQLWGRSVGTILLMVFILLLTTYRLTIIQDSEPTLTWLSKRDLLIPVIGLGVLFAIFLSIQANYLFGSHADLQRFGLTYSEYVRKGFIELLWTTLLGGLLVHLLIIKQNTTVFKLVATVIIIELFLLLVSAFKRDLMYVDTYGLTRVRIIGGIFLLWLTGLLTLLLARAWTSMQESKFMAGVGVLSLLTIIYLNVFNIDTMVIQGAPSHHEYKDYFYINNLSEDGYQGWVDSLPAIQQQVTQLINKPTLTDIEKSQLAGDKLALISFKEKLQKLNLQYGTETEALEYCKNNGCLDFNPNENLPSKLDKPLRQLRTWKFENLSKHTAFQHLSPQKAELTKTIDSLLNRIQSYQVDNGLDLFKQENRLLHEFTYPFLTIRLGYMPIQSQPYTYPQLIGEKFDPIQIKFMSRNQDQVADIVKAPCATASATLVHTGELRHSDTAYPVDKPNSLWYDMWDNSSTTNDQVLHIVASTDTFKKQNPDFCYDQRGCGNHFGTATLNPIAFTDSSGCYQYYELQQWHEIPKIESSPIPISKPIYR